MLECPHCGQEYYYALAQCQECHAMIPLEKDDDPRQEVMFALVELCRVPDEITGMAVQSFLLDAGIEANLKDMRGSFYGNVLSAGQGFWGAVLVSPADEAEARRLYRSFQKQFEGR